MSFVIRHHDGREIFVSMDARHVREAVQEALSERASLAGAVLEGADLHGLDFEDADLEGARLAGASAVSSTSTLRSSWGRRTRRTPRASC